MDNQGNGRAGTDMEIESFNGLQKIIEERDEDIEKRIYNCKSN